MDEIHGVQFSFHDDTEICSDHVDIKFGCKMLTFHYYLTVTLLMHYKTSSINLSHLFSDKYITQIWSSRFISQNQVPLFNRYILANILTENTYFQKTYFLSYFSRRIALTTRELLVFWSELQKPIVYYRLYFFLPQTPCEEKLGVPVNVSTVTR